MENFDKKRYESNCVRKGTRYMILFLIGVISIAILFIFPMDGSEDVSSSKVLRIVGGPTTIYAGEFTPSDYTMVFYDEDVIGNSGSYEDSEGYEILSLKSNYISNKDLSLLEKAGVHTITVKYNGASTQLTITVIDKSN